MSLRLNVLIAMIIVAFLALAAFTTAGKRESETVDAIALTPPAPKDGIVYLNNDTIRLGIDLRKGGAIVYLARVANPRNVVNDHDLGRQIQQSYYSGPHPYGRPAGVWTNAGWNPVASGDGFGNVAGPATSRMEGDTLYTRVVPYQWALDKVRCECVFESWFTLDHETVRVRTRLTNRRSDKAQYPAEPQELPAVYVNGFLQRIVSYTGAAPFSGGPLSTAPSVWPPQPISATEHWAAFVDRSGWGLGIVNPAVTWFDAGFAGPRLDGGALDNQTGYIAPRSREIIDHNIVYTSSYLLVLGTVDQIRSAARSAATPDAPPAFRFRTDRQGWTYVNARDAGWPVQGRLRVTATAPDPQLMGPERWFSAVSVPILYVTAAFSGTGKEAQIFWSTPDQPAYSETLSVRLPVIPDGQVRTYAVDLRRNGKWRGSIRSLRFDPPDQPDSRVVICAIAAQSLPC